MSLEASEELALQLYQSHGWRAETRLAKPSQDKIGEFTAQIQVFTKIVQLKSSQRDSVLDRGQD